MTEDRLQSIESTWGLSQNAVQLTPPALVALEQVKELVAAVRRYKALVKGIDLNCPTCNV